MSWLPMTFFDAETEVEILERTDSSLVGRADLCANWNIGDNPNGGYLLSPLLRAMKQLAPQNDPLSVTTHYLRPGVVGAAELQIELVKTGRTISTLRGELHQGGKQRVEMMASFGTAPRRARPAPGGTDRSIAVPPADMPGPDDCVHRGQLEQGVQLPILDRVEVRIHPDQATAGTTSSAVVSGWIRHIDGRPPDALSLPLFADAFPPSLFGPFGRIGWVPTVELTVHVRGEPVDGWILARFECDDLRDGSMIETGTLWDASGHVVARSRQLGLLLAEDDLRR